MKGSRGVGEGGEKAALRFLQKLGYECVERNYRTRRGEIDLILRDGATLVFVEVKWRRTSGYGDPLEAVTPAKQETIRLVAEEYIAEREPDFEEARFDVVGILAGASPRLTHVKDAF